MAKLPWPPPPEALALLPADLYILPAGSRLWRIYSRGGPHPGRWDGFRQFGPLQTARFDHHLADRANQPLVQARGILYAADGIVTCLAEFFQTKRVINRSRHAPWLVGFETVADLTLLNLRGPWPTAAGASMAINSGDRGRTRRWSTAIYAAYPPIHGLWYASSMYANRPAVALYERAAFAFPAQPIFHRPLDDPALYFPLDAAATRLNYGLL